jgi:uncharacterized membrane protein
MRLPFKIPNFESLEKRLSQRVWRLNYSDLVVLITVTVYAVVFSYLTILKYYAFRVYAADLGIVNQSLWTTLFSGRFLYSTVETLYVPSGVFFAIHFSPIMFLIMPFYAIFPSPETLLVLQSFIIGFGAIPIFWIARDTSKSRLTGVIFALLYLLYVPIQALNWHDFHMQAFLPLFFSLSIYYLIKNRWRRFFVFLILAMMCEEHAAILVVFIGLYIGWRHKDQIPLLFKKRILESKEFLMMPITVAMGAIWYFFTLWFRGTFFSINPDLAYEFVGAGNFSILGVRDIWEIPFAAVSQPLKFLELLSFDWQLKALYIVLFFAPLAFLSVFDSVLLSAVPWIAFSMMSQTAVHHVLSKHHYSAYIISFIFIAGILGFKKVSERVAEKTKFGGAKGLLIGVLICSVVLSAVSSPLSPVLNIFYFGYYQDGGFPQVAQHEVLLSEVTQMVPSDASILTQDRIFPHVSSRLDAYVVPTSLLKNPSKRDLVVEYVNTIISKVDYILVDEKFDPYVSNFIVSLLSNNYDDFSLFASADNNTIRLYKRG